MSHFRLKESIVSTASSPPSKTRTASQRARVIATGKALRQGRAAPGSTLVWLAVAAALLALGALGGWRWQQLDTAELSWQGAASRDERAVGDRGFVEVQPGTSAQVLQRGQLVDVSLSAGSLFSKVEPHRGTRWVVRGGDYQAKAVGTRFLVERSATRFHVAVTEGKVHVTGGKLSPSGILLGAGDTLSIEDGSIQLQRAASAASAGVPPSPPTFETPEQQRAQTEPRPQGHTPAPISSTGIAAAPSAPSAGLAPVDETLPVQRDSTASAGSAASPCTELMRRADRARLSPGAPGAAEALREVRLRCAGTVEAARAAFLLGRLLEGAEPTAAISLYSAYLSEAPRGTFAEQALGRRITAERRAGRAPEARTSAQQYLALYPAGSYARLAESLLLP